MSSEHNEKAIPPQVALVAKEGTISGTVAVRIRGGASKAERERAIDEALAVELSRASETLGVVLAARPVAYTKERPGRDEQGRTVLEVRGRSEGDVLVPGLRGG